jgi:GAF domain-containing protein
MSDAGGGAAPDDRTEAVERLLAAAAERGRIAARLEGPGLERILRSIVEATVDLFDAEAASIALLEDGGRLRFRVAAGERGEGVVGLTVESGEGVAGYVAATGQPMALADVGADPRFGRATAQATGYLPRSLLAVPLELGDRVIGVLEVLDRRGDRPFDLADVARAGVFARQAAVAIDVGRVEAGMDRILVDALARLAADQPPAAAERLVAGAIARLDEGAPPFWTLVDRLASVRSADPATLSLVNSLLDVLIAHLTGRSAGEPGQHPRRVGPTWRDRAGLHDEGPD